MIILNERYYHNHNQNHNQNQSINQSNLEPGSNFSFVGRHLASRSSFANSSASKRNEHSRKDMTQSKYVKRMHMNDVYHGISKSIYEQMMSPVMKS